MRLRHWFLPETPDVVGLLRRQTAVTIEGLEAFTDWAGGDAASGERVHETEERGDAAKRKLLTELRSAFVIPLEPEDVFALSRGIDWILNYAGDVVSESEAMAAPPDAGIAEMAGLLTESVRHIDRAIAGLASGGDDATEAADAALRTERQLEQAYFRGMAGLLGVQDRTERIARRELHRRCVRIGETVVDVAERVIYAVVKET